MCKGEHKVGNDMEYKVKAIPHQAECKAASLIVEFPKAEDFKEATLRDVRIKD